MNIENLLTLATYLESLPEDYKDFEMSDFLRGGDTNKYQQYALENGGVTNTVGCGTVACAVGHGPSAGFLFLPDEFRPLHVWDKNDNWIIYHQPMWGIYCHRVFDVDMIHQEGDYMFGGSWSSHDNHHWGAAARIRYLCDGNPTPNYETYFDTERYAKYRRPAQG